MRYLAILLLATTLQAQTPAAPDNTGRQALTNQLDTLAAQETAARREAIAKIHTRTEAIARQRAVRARMIALLGGPWPEHSPLNPRITGASDHEGIHIERILFDSQPNFPVTALLYLPQHTAKLPAILMAPGHSPTGKAGDAAFALAFANRGFAVLSYDPIGQGERLQYPDPANHGHTLLKAPTGEHGEAGLQPTLIGDALARYFLIDAIRATDYLLTRPEIDPTRIGAFGCSGGGLMTALTAALDTRIAVAGVACFTTSFDTLLPSIGPQDSEQSTPDFISDQPAPSGLSPTVLPPHGKKEIPFAFESQPILDFPDWSELFAPKPYAIIATTEDMFPFAGAQSTEKESRAFYTLFNASDNLAFIIGPGHHGNLRPILPQILDFFTTHLHPTAPAPTTDVSSRPEAQSAAAERPATAAATRPPGPPPPALPAADTQVTPTGQVSTSYPNTETIHTLNLKRFSLKTSQLDRSKLTTEPNPSPTSKLKRSELTAHPNPPSLTLPQLQKAILEVTHAQGIFGTANAIPTHIDGFQITENIDPVVGSTNKLDNYKHNKPFAYDVSLFAWKDAENYSLLANELIPHSDHARKPAILMLEEQVPFVRDVDSFAIQKDPNTPYAREIRAAQDGNFVFAFTPRPSPPGTEETKSPVLGTFYLTELRAELTGKTLMGLRIDDTIHAINYLATRPDVDPNNITAEASGHMALVLLHAAILDPRLKHITLHNLPPTYIEYLHQPIPHDAPQDILPGVLLHYDTPDLIRALGPRVTVEP